jgi:ubiquinone/menaquinone biosynthesis C-methylase UbiE
MVPERVRLAASHGDVMLGSGLELPAASESFDVVYIQHVLHHIGDIETALAEARRVLRPGGYLFLIETIEDSPLIKWGRRLYPHWMGDEINAPFTFEGIRQTVVTAGFDIEQSARYSVLFWMWEILPDQYPAFEKLTPLAVRVEEQLARTFKAYSAHCYLVARK